VPVCIEEATAFTLFGSVVTGEQVGVAAERSPLDVSCCEGKEEAPHDHRRVALPLV
jgi:hypothetical protein